MFVWLGWVLVLITLPLFDVTATVEHINTTLKLSADPVTTHSYIASRVVGYFDWAAATLIGFAGWRLMTGYLNGDIFSETAAVSLKRLGQAALIATFTDIIARPLSTWIMSATHFYSVPAWQFLMPQDLLYIVIGFFIIGLARIFRVAAEINAENKQFI